MVISMNIENLYILVCQRVGFANFVHFSSFKNVDTGGAKELMSHLVKLQSSLSEVNKYASSLFIISIHVITDKCV